MLLPNRHRLWVRLLVALGAMALFVLGYQWGNRTRYGGPAPPNIQGVLVRPPGVIPGFTLRDPFGQAFDQDRLERGWTLLAFGDLSAASGQRAVQRLIDLYNRVADQPALRQSLDLILVMTHPSPALARDFARLSPALHLLDGDPEEVARLQGALGLLEEGLPTLFLFGPGARLIALFPETETGSDMAEDLEAIFARASTLLPEEP